MSSRPLRLLTRSSISSVVTVSGGRDELAVEAEFGAGLHLAADVDLRRGTWPTRTAARPGRMPCPARARTSSATSCLIAAAMAAPSRTFGMHTLRHPSYRFRASKAGKPEIPLCIDQREDYAGGMLSRWLWHARLAGVVCLALGSIAAYPSEASSAPGGNVRAHVIEGLGKDAVLLDEGWQFQTGDNTAWASPGYDDAGWKTLRGDATWGTQGYPAYEGFAWYRYHLSIKPVAEGPKDLALHDSADRRRL